MDEQTTLSAEQKKKQEQEQAIMKEMMPYFVYAMIPIAITIAIAVTFAPKMTLP
jgi:hypothetical protein